MKALVVLTMCVAGPTLAQTPPAVQSTPSAAAVETALDPAAVAAAKPVIDRLWPLGTYRRLMDGTMSKMIDAMMDQMSQMRSEDMNPVGKPDREASGKTMGELMQASDPHYRERMRITTEVMFKEMLPLFDRVEPMLRDSMTRIYARKFSVAQLGDMERFFAAPTGEIYAREWMLAFMDPEMVKGMQAFMPDLIKAMPAIMAKVTEATKHLPPLPKRTNAK